MTPLPEPCWALGGLRENRLLPGSASGQWPLLWRGLADGLYGVLVQHVGGWVGALTLTTPDDCCLGGVYVDLSCAVRPSVTHQQVVGWQQVALALVEGWPLPDTAPRFTAAQALMSRESPSPLNGLLRLELFRHSLSRPTDYFALPPSEQWAVDYGLGLLDWDICWRMFTARELSLYAAAFTPPPWSL